MNKFVIKNESEEFYCSSGDFSFRRDTSNSNIELFDDEKQAQDYMKEHSSLFKDEDCEIVEVYVHRKFYEKSKDPEVSQAKLKMQETLLKVCDHYDAITTILNEPSLNHDVNAVSGRICRTLEQAGMNFTNAEVYEYSDAVGKRTYRDKDGHWLPHKMLNADNLAFKARRAAEFFATMADTLAFLDKYEEWAIEKRRANNEQTDT